MPIKSQADDSERFRRLTRWHSIFNCTRHDHKVVDWNYEDAPSSENSRFDYEARLMPTMSYDEGVSVKARRPDSSQYVGSAIVEKFTDLLFDIERRPQIVVGGGKRNEAERYIREIAKKTKVFDKFVDIRDAGGSSSSVFVYIAFSNKSPKIKHVESRFCIPTFEDEDEGTLENIVIQYVYSTTEEVFNKDTKKTSVKTVNRWWREEITKNEYIYYNNPECLPNKDPEFYEISRITHNLNIFPGIWIYNRRKVGIDSIPDYYGAEDLIDKIDMLSSQSNRAAIYNGDPTMHIASDKEIPDARVGSFNTVNTSANGRVAMVTIGPEAIEAITTVIGENIAAVERICKVDLSSFSGLQGRDRVTATEVSKMQGDMFAQASKLRVRYGDAIRTILHKIYLMCNGLSNRIILANNSNAPGYSGGGEQPLRFIVDKHFLSAEKIEEFDIELKWGKYISVSPSEMKTVIDAVAVAVSSGVLDRITATQVVCAHLPMSIDEEELINRVESEYKKSIDAETKTEDNLNIPDDKKN